LRCTECGARDADFVVSGPRVEKGTMLDPFDWYSIIPIGIAAAVAGVVVLIAWLTGQIPPPRK